MGRHFWNQMTAAALQNGLQHFERAVQQDPRYALAHEPVADSYIALAIYSVVSPQEGYTKGRAAAAKALDLNPALSEAHATLALVSLYYRRVSQGAYAGPELLVNTPDARVGVCANACVRRSDRSVYVGLADHDQAFAWLEKAYDERTRPLLSLNVNPRLDPLRSDPRLAALMRRVGVFRSK